MQDKDRKEQKRRGKPGRDALEIGVVRVFSNPGPDAQDRLRRLLSLMVRYATGDGRSVPGRDSATDEEPPADCTGGDEVES